MKRKPKFVLPTKYILLILSGVCIVAILLSFTLGISGGPLNTVAGYVFIPMQRGINSVGSWIGEKADNLKKLNDVMAENEDLKRQVDDCETEIEQTESAIAILEEKMATPEGASDMTLYEQHQKLKQQLDRTVEEWEKVSIELEELKQ